MNTPVNFEIAKLLKEKGYSSITEDPIYYYINEVNNIKEHQLKNQSNLYYADFDYILLEDEYPAPTISQVVMWLYEKHDIWIECLHRGDMGNFTFKISKLKKGWRTDPHYIHDKGFNLPTEAYIEAIKYCLTKLI